MNQAIIDLWAEIGSLAYWPDFTAEFGHDLVPFKDRWPQPGYVGNRYFESALRVVVMVKIHEQTTPRGRATPIGKCSD